MTLHSAPLPVECFYYGYGTHHQKERIQRVVVLRHHCARRSSWQPRRDSQGPRRLLGIIIFWLRRQRLLLVLHQSQQVHLSSWLSQVSTPRQRPKVRVPLFPPSLLSCITCGASWSRPSSSWTGARAARKVRRCRSRRRLAGPLSTNDMKSAHAPLLKDTCILWCVTTVLRCPAS